MSTALLRMADAPVLPFEFKQVVNAIRGYLADLSKQKELQTLGPSRRSRQAPNGRRGVSRTTYRKAIAARLLSSQS